MDIAEAEQEEEELSEWVLIQTSPNSQPTPPDSPIVQPSHRRDNDDDEEDSVVSGFEDESSSSKNLLLPWRVIEIAKKRLKVSGFFQAVERARCNYVTRQRVFWSFTLVGGFFLVSSLVYVKLLRWLRRLQEEKLRFLLLLRQKDQKLKELMLEIGRLNELLASRRKVRVVRIV